MRWVWWINIISISMISGSCLAYIYQIHVLRRWDKELKQYQYIIGLSDFHDKSLPINKTHRRYLKHVLSRCPVQKTKIVVEDLSSTNSNGRRSCGRFAINSRGGVLGGLADELKSMNADVENIEYRYCRVVSLGPLINNVHVAVDSFASSNSLAIDALYREVLQEINQVRSFADGRALSSSYKRTINHVKCSLKQLQLDRYKNMSVADYCARFAKSGNRLNMLQTFCTFDSDLLDLKLVHEVVNAHQQSHIIAIAGGTHIEHAANLLKRAGFKPVFVSRLSSLHEYDLGKCLGSNIVDNSFCIKPEPVDITLIERFLSQ